MPKIVTKNAIVGTRLRKCFFFHSSQKRTAHQMKIQALDPLPSKILLNVSEKTENRPREKAKVRRRIAASLSQGMVALVV